MPIYEYECQKCLHTFEKIISASDNSAIECPQCHSEEIKKMMSSGSVRPQGIPKGSGGFTPPPCSGNCRCGCSAGGKE